MSEPTGSSGATTTREIHLRERIEELQAENARLREDKQRLDWLDDFSNFCNVKLVWGVDEALREVIDRERDEE